MSLLPNTRQIRDYKKIFVFDVETTGLNPKQADIIELGGVLLEQTKGMFKIVKKINVLVKVIDALPKKITELTNITDAMLLKDGIDGWELADILEAIFIEKPLLVAYNLHFDIGFIHAIMERYKPIFKITMDVLDMLTVYKDYHPYPHRLENAIERYQIQFPNSHRAIDDTLATTELFKKMHHAFKIDTYINVLGFNPKFGLKGYKLPYVRYLPQSNEPKSIYHQVKD